MVTQNQLDPIVQKAVGRTATPYEVQTFSTLSPQALASLPEYYSGLNKNTSIVDYLKFNGQDPNSRIDLAKQYGITNIGTAEGNTALLNALKSGKPPVTTPVTGSISSSSTSQGTTTPQTTGNGQTTSQGNTVSGSVSTAATQPATDTTTNTSDTPPTSDGTIDTDPDVWTANKAVNDTMSQYQGYQNQIAKIDQQVSTLRQSQQNLYDDRVKEITEAGGTPIESQVRADVSEQNREIQEQINGLLDDRAPLATSQSQYSSLLTQARDNLKQAQADFYKNANLGISTKKLSDSELKNNQAIGKSILTAIGNGSITLDPDQATQLETSLGLPAGYLSNSGKKTAVIPASTNTTTTAPLTIFGIPTPFSSTKTSTKTAVSSAADPAGLNQ